jgi:hypothetical protein
LVKTRTVLAASMLSAVLYGCGGTYFEHRDSRDIPEGPGMLTGERGAFVIYSDRQSDQAKQAPADSPCSSPSSEECREFREFQRSKASAREAAEYREFQEWRATRNAGQGQAK